MTLRLYLDECAYAKRLVDLLRGDPYRHDVETPADAGLLGEDDAEHFAYARSRDLVLVTKNPNDFKELHRGDPEHPGVIAIYQDNRPGDMSPEDIARAIQNLADADIPLRGVFHVLNAWDYEPSA